MIPEAASPVYWDDIVRSAWKHAAAAYGLAGMVERTILNRFAKSYVGLMRHLRFIQDPNYKAYCIRKNSSAIMASGGLFQEAVKLYSQVDPNLKIRLKDQKVVFSSGAEISFSHYENANAAKKYQGIQISNIFYDRICRFYWKQ